MRLKPIQLQLEAAQAGELIGIVLDDDAEHALDFIKSVLVKQVEKALQRH